MVHEYTDESEMDRAKFALWCGMEPIHDSASGLRVEWNTPPDAAAFMLSVWDSGESPLMRWIRRGKP